MGANNHMSASSGSDGNESYLGKTLRYNNVELSFDESVSWRALWHLWLRAFIASFVVWVLFAFIGIIVLLTSSNGSSSYSAYGGGGSDPSSGALTLLSIGSLVGFLVFWVVLLFSKQPEPIAEWRVLLADRGDKADSVYSQISGTLRDRQLPIGWRVRRIRTGLGSHNVSNRLVMTERSYTAYVSVFNYGTSLYLGWTMWRTRRGSRLVAQFIVDLFEGLVGRRDMERQMMRTERPRAMREALHAACRESLFTAAEGRDVPVDYGFPQGLPPIEDAEIGPAPVPGGFPQSIGPRQP